MNKKRHPVLCPNIAAERLYFENYMNHFEARYCKKKFQKMRKKVKITSVFADFSKTCL